MPLDPNSHVPIYEQIIDLVHGLVAAGLYGPEDPLPSIRALALELVVNPNTVQRAYQELERQGIVTMRRGLGVYVAVNSAAAARARSEGAVRERFGEGVRLGRAARLTDDALGALFGRALKEAGGDPAAGQAGRGEAGGAGTKA